MNYDDKVTQGFGAVACTDKLVFLGHLGPNAKISIFRFQEGAPSLKFVGFLSPIVGTVNKILLTRRDSKLICNTNCGYIYVWDVGEETVNTLESLTNNPLYIDGYIPLDVRVRPVAVIEPEDSSGCTDVDLLHNDVVIGVAKWPELTLSFYSSKTGQKFAASSSLLGDSVDKKKYLRCLKADPQVVREGDDVKGQWVAMGSDSGSFYLTFVPTLNPDDSDSVSSLDLKIHSFDLPEAVNVNAIAWRFRNKTSLNLTVICGCSDGTIKCFVLNSETEELKMSKQASYLYSKASISATVNRIICLKDTKRGFPFVIASCNMIGELGNFDFGDLATNCVFEAIYQKLQQDSSDDIVSFAKVQDFITDLAISPANKFVFLVSASDSVYLSSESQGEDEKTPWSRPVKLTWRTTEFSKFLNN